MVKYNFKDDYSEGCHPNILKKLSETNFDQQDGYGDDEYSREAKELIKKLIEKEKAEIYFVSGGTQANLVIISSVLRSHESVISVSTGHIASHEAGAIEATGHKINSVDSPDGKLRVDDICKVLKEHELVPHMVKPKLVYISDSTEMGTIYKKEDLKELSDYCKNNDLYLFIDGARLGPAISSIENDITLKDIAELTDIFYIGGTKNGALLGEAIVIINKKLKEDFAFHIKQRGGLMSKGRVAGIQFLELFKNDLFFQLATHADKMAQKIKTGLEEAGYSFLTDSPTNLILPVLPDKLIKEMQKIYGFHMWGNFDDNRSTIRLITSWATKEEAVEEFISDLLSFNIY